MLPADRPRPGGGDRGATLGGRAADADLATQLSESRIDELCDPANYLGSAHTMTATVINEVIS